MLYHYPGCMYCARVWDAARKLGLEFESRDILRDEEACAELVQATGARTVPVLRIEQDGETRWQRESTDIIRYLYAQYGGGKTPGLSLWLNPQLVLVGSMAIAMVVDSQVHPSWPWPWIFPLAAGAWWLRGLARSGP